MLSPFPANYFVVFRISVYVVFQTKYFAYRYEIIIYWFNEHLAIVLEATSSREMGNNETGKYNFLFEIMF